MEIKALATGSKGNCYHITDGSTPLLLEAGIQFKEIQRKLNFQTSNIAGCLITHEHQDHCKGVKTILERGLNVYMSKGTKEALNIQHHRIKTVESKNSSNSAPGPYFRLTCSMTYRSHTAIYCKVNMAIKYFSQPTHITSNTGSKD